ncbi:MAG: UPF0175 family protein [Desulfobacterales bacterium]|nr:UPF0175 family protein [Desulfobacterales bacterium]
MDIPESQPEKRIKELIAVALFRDGRISSGKGAELLSITKLDFILLLRSRSDRRVYTISSGTIHKNTGT